jgi:hypothetical protein
VYECYTVYELKKIISTVEKTTVEKRILHIYCYHISRKFVIVIYCYRKKNISQINMKKKILQKNLLYRSIVKKFPQKIKYIDLLL